MSGFCLPDDVREVLQKEDLRDSYGTDIVASAIEGVSSWFANATNTHWYDSSASSSDLLPTTPATQTDVHLDVPSSPHATDRQIHRSVSGVRYPVTTHGPYARIPLPHAYVETLNRLDVRGRGGDVEDWVAASDKSEGRGDEYYVARRGQNSYGQTYLYIRARSIGARVNFDGLLTLDYDYGLDWQDDEWQDVRRGAATLAAAEVADEDGVLAQIPNNARLVGVETEHDHLMSIADRLLGPYLRGDV